MQAFKVGKLVTFVAIIILLVVAILSPYSVFKKDLFYYWGSYYWCNFTWCK